MPVSRVLYDAVGAPLSFIWSRCHHRDLSVYPPRHSAVRKLNEPLMLSFDRIGAYLTFQPVRFTMPPGITTGAVGSYPTFSPLPQRIRAVYFLWHCLSRPIRTSLPVRKYGCSALPGLSSPRGCRGAIRQHTRLKNS